MSVTGPESGLLLVPFLYSYAVIRVFKVEFSKDPYSYEPIKCLIDEGEWIAILYSDLIQATVVDAKS